MSIIFNKFFAILAFFNIIERASYYGLQGIFVLYIVDSFGLSQDDTYDLYGVFFTLIYTLPLLMGYLLRKNENYTFLLKLVFILSITGFVLISFQNNVTLYTGMMFIILSTALFKIVSPGVLGRFYDLSPDLSRDSGFTYMYLFMNLGALLSFLVAGWIGEMIGWRYALYFLAFLNGSALLVLFFLKKRFAIYDSKPEKNDKAIKPHIPYFQIIGFIFSLLIVFVLLTNVSFFNYLFSVVLILTVIGSIFYIFRLKGLVKKHILSIFLVIFSYVLYLSAFNQKENSINMFTFHHIDRVVMNFEVPTTWFLSINPIIVFVFGAIIAGLWSYLNRIKKEPNFAVKFSLAWAVMGIAYFFYFKMAADAISDGKTHMYFLIVGHILISFSEILAIPLVFSWITDLSPKNMKTIFIGLGTFAGAVGNFLAAQIAKLTTESQPNTDAISEIFNVVYLNIAIACVVVGLCMCLIGVGMKRYFIFKNAS